MVNKPRPALSTSRFCITQAGAYVSCMLLCGRSIVIEKDYVCERLKHYFHAELMLCVTPSAFKFSLTHAHAFNLLAGSSQRSGWGMKAEILIFFFRYAFWHRPGTGRIYACGDLCNPLSTRAIPERSHTPRPPLWVCAGSSLAVEAGSPHPSG